MDRRTFRNIAERIRPYTDYVYLHVLGEPLIHPQFAGIVEDARSLGLHVNLTTNGRQVAEQKRGSEERPPDQHLATRLGVQRTQETSFHPPPVHP